MIQAGCDSSKNSSTEVLQMQNLFDQLQEYFDRYCNTLPVFGFLCARYDMNLIKSYLLPFIVFKFVMFNFLTFYAFSEMLPMLVQPRKLTKHPRRKGVFSIRMVSPTRKIEQQRTSSERCFSQQTSKLQSFRTIVS